MRVIGYVRVSTAEQAISRAGLDAQRAAIAAEAERRGWTLVATIEDAGYSARDLKRPGIRQALDVLAAGQGDALVVAKLDRLSRSMLDFAAIMARAQKESWGMVALDVNVDTTTPSGEMMANVMAAFAQFERRLIGQRTREALAQRRAEGVRLGRVRVVAPELEQRVRTMKADGMTFRAIAAQLDADGVTTPGGGPWRTSTLHRILARAAEERA